MRKRTIRKHKNNSKNKERGLSFSATIMENELISIKTTMPISQRNRIYQREWDRYRPEIIISQSERRAFLVENSEVIDKLYMQCYDSCLERIIQSELLLRWRETFCGVTKINE